MDFTFKCSVCGGKNTTAVDMIGTMMHCTMCESEIEVPLTGLSSGMVEGNYWIHSLVGTGSVSEVYITKLMSTDEDQGENRVYMKVMSPLATMDQTATHDFFQRICQSAQVIHPNILSVIDTGIMHGHYFAATPYIEGEPLDKIIERKGPLEETEALKVCLRVARFMQQVWNEQGLVHQALKPANILINNENEVFLLDLCNSKQCLVPADGRLETINPKGNLFDYMSPEQIQDLPDLDPTSDIYSLGASLHFMICGEKPYTDTMTSSIAQKHLWSAPPQLEAHKRDVSPAIADLVRWMMSGRTAGEPRTWEELIARIRPIYKKQSKRSASTHTRPKIKTAIHTKSGGISRREAASSTQAIKRRRGGKTSTHGSQREEIPETSTQVITQKKKGAGVLIAAILALVFLFAFAAGGIIWLTSRNNHKDDVAVAALRMDDGLFERRLRRARTYGKSSKASAERWIRDLETLRSQTKDEEQLSRIAEVISMLQGTAAAVPVTTIGSSDLILVAVANAQIGNGRHKNVTFAGGPQLQANNAENGHSISKVFLRFDLSGLPSPPTSATLRLYTIDASEATGACTVQLVTDDSWKERKISGEHRPQASGAALATFTPTTEDFATADLTAAVKEQFEGDKMISLYVFPKVKTTKGLVTFASRKHENTKWRPALIVQCGKPSDSKATPTPPKGTTTPPKETTTTPPKETITTPPKRTKPMPAGTKTIFPEADAYVCAGSNSGKNYGRESDLINKNIRRRTRSHRESYLRFDLSKLPSPIVSAKLRLYVRSVGSTAGAQGVKLVKDDSWSEDGISYSRRPAGSGGELATFQPEKSTYVNLDLTAAVKKQVAADKKISLFIYAKKDTGGNGNAYFASREHENAEWRPALIVKYGRPSSSRDAPTGAQTILPEADACVRGGKHASANSGGDSSLTVKKAGRNPDYDRKIYMRFDLRTISPTITSAKLRLWALDVSGGVGKHYIQLVADDSWSEDGIVSNNAPSPVGSHLGTFTPTANSPTEIDLTAAVKKEIAKDKKISLFIYSLDTSGRSGTSSFASKEHATAKLRPVLITE